MNANDREQLRLSLLRFLDAAVKSDRPLAESLLLQMAKAEGRPELTIGELRGELDYLAGKGLIITPAKIISPENRQWKITSAGRDEYAQLIPE